LAKGRKLWRWHSRMVRQPMQVGGWIAGTAGSRDDRLNCEGAFMELWGGLRRIGGRL